MPLITAAVRGELRAAMEAEVRDAARAMRRGVERAGREVQAELRAQARAAGFSDRGRAVANAWRLSLYPPPAAAPRTLRPAALVWTNAPKLVDAFDRGIPIVARGKRYLAFPTPYNAAGGRRGASARGGLRVTPAQMQAARREAFVIRSKSNPSVRLAGQRGRPARRHRRIGGFRRSRRNRRRARCGAAALGGLVKGHGTSAMPHLARKLSSDRETLCASGPSGGHAGTDVWLLQAAAPNQGNVFSCPSEGHAASKIASAMSRTVA